MVWFVACIGLPPVSAQQAQSVVGGCAAMTAPQRAVATKLLDSITDQFDVTATYLGTALDCLKGKSVGRPTMVSSADRNAHAEWVLLLTAKGIPAP